MLLLYAHVFVHVLWNGILHPMTHYDIIRISFVSRGITRNPLLSCVAERQLNQLFLVKR